VYRSSLIFCFFCIKTKEKGKIIKSTNAKEKNQSRVFNTKEKIVNSFYDYASK